VDRDGSVHRRSVRACDLERVQLSWSMHARPRACGGLLALLILGSCAPTWSPAQIDEVSARCQTDLRDGSLALRPSRAIGIPEHARPTGEPVVVYGASWCSACEIATAYLARRGIPYVERDIEKDRSAAAACKAALNAVGLRFTGSIPVIDVRGFVTIGFFPCAIEQAWSSAGAARPDG
jgi:glutaredoxin